MEQNALELNDDAASSKSRALIGLLSFEIDKICSIREISDKETTRFQKIE